MDIEKEFAKVGFNHERYEAIMSDIQDKLNGNNDLDWEDIVNKYGLSISSDALRKSQSRPFGGVFAKEYYENKNSVGNYIEQLDEIRREKQKLFDERAALKKIGRDNARAEENWNHLADLIKENGKTIFPPVSVKIDNSDNDILVCLSDFHLGIDAETAFGKYNSDIAKQRLCNLLVEILKIQRRHHSQNVTIACLGDLLSGNLHITVQLENRENVVKQIQMTSEYLSAFTYELSKHFENVYVADVPGNHSRIGLKENVLRDERLDDLVIWYMEAKLEHLTNVHFVKEKYDETIGTVTIRGNEFWLVHGDYDAYSEAGLNKLCMFIGHKPTGVLTGHLHHCSFDDINDVKFIRSGSFSGSCDNYTVQKRLYSKPSQMVCVIDKDGVQAFYPVILS